MTQVRLELVRAAARLRSRIECHCLHAQTMPRTTQGIESCDEAPCEDEASQAA
jgi:hypothetical protein